MSSHVFFPLIFKLFQGLGGFKLGCYGDFPTPPPPIPNCEKYGPNPLGKCNCDDQLFIKDDCNQVQLMS